MSRLSNKHIIIAITGGIAAYKGAELVRLCKTAGAQVQVVMTQSATEFITPLTLQALSGHPVHQFLLDAQAEAGMGHIQLARWADLIIVAPCTANTLADLAHGRADQLLTALCLATQAPIALAPAMNQAMWNKAATQANIDILQQRDYMFWGPANGEQACGDIGPGRILEPSHLLTHAESIFTQHKLQGKQVVITAGPTQEALDPVRYLTNRSSGKMGYALAMAAVEAGANTTLISGPTHLDPPEGVHFVPVNTAKEMLDACIHNCAAAHLFIASAAVADYRPEYQATQKIKKTTDTSTLTMTLVKNPDILATIASQYPDTTCVGFAAETQSLLPNAQAKLEQKKVSMIIANDISNSAIGFDSNNNQVTLVTATQQETLPIMSKAQLARQLIQRLGTL